MSGKEKFLFTQLKKINIVILIIFLNKNCYSSEIEENISKYLEKTYTLLGNFRQRDNFKNIYFGKFYYKKPNMFLFNYKNPENLKIISDGFWLSIQDSKARTSDRYFLSMTPLKLLLTEEPKVEGRMISEDDTFYLLRSTDAETRASITIYFHKSPVQIAGWVSDDGNGQKTKIILDEIVRNKDVPNSFFAISDFHPDHKNNRER
jgi:outer membrane lipoprotein-sorting protein